MKSDPGPGQASGLSDEQVREALERYGPNTIPIPKLSLYRIYIAPLLNLLIDIYLVITAILAVLAFFVPSAGAQVVVWFGIIALNASVAIAQQARARKQLGALERLAAARCRVIRGGSIKEIPAEQVVPGDLVLLEQGDRIPADARVVSSADLHVNQAALTGESVDVEKSDKEVAKDNDEDHSRNTIRPRNMVYLGTFVTSGSGLATVTATGRATELGRISSQLRTTAGLEKLHLRVEVNRIAKYLAAAVVAFLVASLAFKFGREYMAGTFVAANSLRLTSEVVRTLIAAMSIMPINIPLLTTIVLVTGVLAMARSRVIVRDLNSIEVFSRISIICTDKTGTLTKGEMTASWLCFPNLRMVYGVKGTGFGEEKDGGEIFEAPPGSPMEEIVAKNPEEFTDSAPAGGITPESHLWYMLVCGFLDNEAHRVQVTGGEEKGEATTAAATTVAGDATSTIVGNHTDVSLMTLFAKSGIDEREVRGRFEMLRTFAFHSGLKRMSRVCRDVKRGSYVVFTKGGTEVVLPLCTRVVAEDAPEGSRPLDEGSRMKITAAVNLFAQRGYRVISFCYRYSPDLADLSKDRSAVEADLVYLGFAAMLDPPRPGIREVVEESRRAGVRPVMVTGDNTETARTVAEEVGIIARSTERGSSMGVLTGTELHTCSDEAFLDASVFARVSPEDKMMIVRRYQRLGHPVAMTGDGVNDALALSASDIGVAMGEGGTEVAKQSADVILTDDSFASIVEGLRQGRSIFQKIRSMIFFYIAVNIAEGLVFFGAEFIPGYALLNPWQHIFILVTAHTFPPFALIADHLDRDVMKQKPKEKEGIITRKLLVALFLFALTLGAFLAIVLYYFGAPLVAAQGSGPTRCGLSAVCRDAETTSRTMFIGLVLISETLLALSLRRINKSIPQMIREEPRWPAWGLIPIPVLALVVLVYLPSIQVSMMRNMGMDLSLVPLSPAEWALVAAFAVIPVLCVELYKAYVRRRGEEF